jgi:hypothetical protein
VLHHPAGVVNIKRHIRGGASYLSATFPALESLCKKTDDASVQKQPVLERQGWVLSSRWCAGVRRKDPALVFHGVAAPLSAWWCRRGLNSCDLGSKGGHTNSKPSPVVALRMQEACGEPLLVTRLVALVSWGVLQVMALVRCMVCVCVCVCLCVRCASDDVHEGKSKSGRGARGFGEPAPPCPRPLRSVLAAYVRPLPFGSCRMASGPT